MPKKKEAPAGAPLWMVTYSDMVTLLLTFFVMLLAMANFEDTSQVDAVMGSIRFALGSGSQPKDGVGPDTKSHEFEMNKTTMDKVGTSLRDSLSKHLSDQAIQMTKTPNELRLQLNDRILFAPGSAEINPAAYQMLRDIGEALKGQSVSVEVEGHTDATGATEDNWRVSSERALAVLFELQQRSELGGQFLQANAMGEYHPADLEGGSSEWNRRVELVIRGREAVAMDALDNVEGD
ncbi:MAG: flagellar motor protein MotB [Myxococcota bacterium]